ncbi:hypothetical protein ADUPG1_001284, partial [Aduncisulcus paluster]
MKKLIAIALLVGSIITAFYGFSLTAPMLAGKTMSDVNDIMGNMHWPYWPEQQVFTYFTLWKIMMKKIFSDVR